MKRTLALLILSIAFIAGCQERKLYKDTRVAMGTYVEVVSPDNCAADVVFGEIERVEGLLSKYLPDSDISKLNRLGRLKVSPETFYVIKKAKDFSMVTGGAFDITVAPLMDLWGFTDRRYKVPDSARIKETLKLVGSDKIILHPDDNMVEFSLPGMKIDLGGIAKGYALDCAVKKLKESGVKSCLIAAGQVYALGDKFGSPWTIRIKDPRRSGLSRKLQVKDVSVATSGDYEQFFKVGGRRYCHIIDPRRGRPTESGLASVTVIASDGLTADALSTAIFVLGKENGSKLAKELKIKCLIKQDQI